MPDVYDSTNIDQNVHNITFACLLASADPELRESSCRIWHNEGMPTTSFYSSDPMTALSRIYTIPDRSAVEAYISQHSELIAVLAEAPDRIKEHFPYIALELAMSSDPEAEHDHLVLWINAPDDPEAAIRQLLCLTRKWWGNIRRRNEGKLVISIGVL